MGILLVDTLWLCCICYHSLGPRVCLKAVRNATDLSGTPNSKKSHEMGDFARHEKQVPQKMIDCYSKFDSPLAEVNKR